MVERPHQSNIIYMMKLCKIEVTHIQGCPQFTFLLLKRDCLNVDERNDSIQYDLQSESILEDREVG